MLAAASSKITKSFSEKNSLIRFINCFCPDDNLSLSSSLFNFSHISSLLFIPKKNSKPLSLIIECTVSKSRFENISKLSFREALKICSPAVKYPICFLKFSVYISLIFTSLINTFPSCISYSLHNILHNVDLPDPDPPNMPNFSAFPISKLMFCRA